MAKKRKLFDARPDRLDLRDREYQPRLKSLPHEFPSGDDIKKYLPIYQQCGLILNQGGEGACTGFGLAATINYLNWREDNKLDSFSSKTAEQLLALQDRRVSERMLYQLAKIYDEWPGEDYSGSSCRGAMKGWHKHGVCRKSLWEYSTKKYLSPSEGWEKDALKNVLGSYYRINKDSVTDMQSAIYEVGAIYCSAQVHEGWVIDEPQQALSVISFDDNARSIGGHAFCIVGYNKYGFIVQNSWGKKWGWKGFAILSYKDWVKHGYDAWVVSRGVPQAVDEIPTMLARDSLQDLAGKQDSVQRSEFFFGRNKPKYEYPESSKTKPWSYNEALKYALMIENNGRPRHTVIAAKNCEDSAKSICETHLEKWLKNKNTNRKIMIYAHGGLTSEDNAIDKIRVMGPCFKANNIYPIFAVWKTGGMETLGNIIEEEVLRKCKKSKAKAEGLNDLIDWFTDKTDAMVETVARSINAKGIWAEMKENAILASDRAIPGYAQNGAGKKGAMVLLAQSLSALKEKYPNLEVHIVGHSAGSILLGAWLNECIKRNLSIKTASLYAPACTIKFANQTYVKAFEKNILPIDQLYIHNLTDKAEKHDQVTKIYNKSLLYLVSRGLESIHKMPILGLDAAWEKDNYNKKETGGFNYNHKRDIAKWLDHYDKNNLKLYKLDDPLILTANPETGEGINFEEVSHGGFDNDIRVIAETIKLIRGGALIVPLENLTL